MQFVKSQKGRNTLFHEGYKYRKDKQREGHSTWRCSKSGCKGRLMLSGDTAKPTTEHNHAPNPVEKVISMVKETIREGASKTDANPREIIQQACSSLISEEAAVSLPSYEASRRTVQRIRNKKFLSSSALNDISEVRIGDKYSKTDRGEVFLLWDSGKENRTRLLIFGTYKNLDLLKEFPHWAIDGTFKTCPTLFCQLFVIHALIDSKAVPLVYALLPNKSEGIYVELFNTLKTLDAKLKPETILVDFEQSSINAVKKVFSNTRIVGCSFHLAQNLWRKIQHCQLTNLYRDNENIRTKCKMLLALSYIPEKDVQFALEVICENFPDELKPVVEYWEDNYVGKRINNIKPRFSINLWNQYERVASDLPKTNNSLEAWHNSLQKGLNCQHPHIYKLINQLKKEQKSSEIFITRYRSGFRKKESLNNKYVQLKNRLKTLVQTYAFSNVEKYLQSVAHNLSM